MTSEPEIALILSLGGSPAGQIQSVLHHRPKLVVFFASEQSVDLASEIRKAANEQGIEFKNRKVLCEDVQSLGCCFEDACKAMKIAHKAGYAYKSILVDYTGGTKTMSAALVLAAIQEGCRFSYVGGHQRTKDGLGIVQNGSEEIILSENPWELFGVQYQEHYMTGFQGYQFHAARQIAEEAIQRCQPAEEALWKTRAQLAEACEAWDRFSHKDALKLLNRVHASLERLLHVPQPDPELSALKDSISRSCDFLRTLQDSVGGQNQPYSSLMLQDLLANADRRAEEGKFDDATARIYRALEMIGQIAILEKLGCTTSKIPVDRIPEKLRKQYQSRYGDGKGETIKTPLDATFRLLAELNDPVGGCYMRNEKELKNILYQRNMSILAHGQTPIEEKHYRRLREILQKEFKTDAKVPFPKIENA